MDSKKDITSEILNRLVESSLDAIIAIDDLGYISVFNKKAEEILGYKAADIIGKSINILYKDIQEARRIGQLITQQEKISNLETFMRGTDDSKIPILLSASLLRDQSGKIIGQAGYFRDFRQTKLLEEKLKVLVSATTIVNSNLDLSETLQSIVVGIQKAFECDLVTLYIYDEDREEILFPPIVAGQVMYPDTLMKLGNVSKNSAIYRVLNGDTIVAAENAVDDNLFAGQFTKREEVHSAIGIPLTVAGRHVGVLFANYRTPHRFSSVEIDSIALFANQAAIAIRNAQLYKEVQKRISALQSLYEASRVISSYIDLDHILQLIVEQAGELTSRVGKVANLSYISLYERASNKLILKASYPPKLYSKLKESIGEIDLLNGSRRGIAGRAVMVKQSNLTFDVRKDPDYINLGMDTLSELAVPIIVGEELIGVINVEHQEINAFDREDVQIIEALAAQAGIAIQNARRYEEIQRTKGLIGAKTAVAWMGMASSVWRHSVEGKAINIRDLLTLIYNDVANMKISKSDKEKLNERLKFIEELTKGIIEKPITPPISSDAADDVLINELLRERIQQLSYGEPYRQINIVLNLNAPKDTTIRSSPEWLRRAIDIIIDNAARVILDTSNPEIVISTNVVGKELEITIKDNGPGISKQVLSKLFSERIEKASKSETGMGMGLLMAQAIVNAYDGDIFVKFSGSNGTTMAIKFPVS